MSGWQLRGGRMRLEAYGYTYSVRPVGGGRLQGGLVTGRWQAMECVRGRTVRERMTATRAGAVEVVDAWVTAAAEPAEAEAAARREAAFAAAQMGLFDDDCDEETDDDACAAPGGAT